MGGVGTGDGLVSIEHYTESKHHQCSIQKANITNIEHYTESKYHQCSIQKANINIEHYTESKHHQCSIQKANITNFNMISIEHQISPSLLGKTDRAAPITTAGCQSSTNHSSRLIEHIASHHIQLVTKFGEDWMKFRDRQTDRQTDQQSDSYITPITNGNGDSGKWQTDQCINGNCSQPNGRNGLDMTCVWRYPSKHGWTLLKYLSVWCMEKLKETMVGSSNITLSTLFDLSLKKSLTNMAG
ncbi:hypothetical protein DPMN_129225 [Dreissena polymorpha]|uniref:Uncharacterized protein n=1 Tax=Dreissena polymorpha TaxID=45954 RepID=A0A9D4H5D4_DREPO|nr:hypothetical protein DPMN_129225 [Dreissena polymorpha]